MEAIQIKEELHHLVESADEKLFYLMFALANKYNSKIEFTEAELMEIKRRRENHLNGRSKSYTWSEAKSIITKGEKI